MRRVCIAATVLLIMILSSWSYSVDSLELNQEKEANGRAANVIISELFISPNNLVANDTSDNVYGAVDWNGDGDFDSEDLVYAFTQGVYVFDVRQD